jgi:hypothetical protein
MGGQVLTTLAWNNKVENSPRLELALFIMLLHQLRNLATYIPANQRPFWLALGLQRFLILSQPYSRCA